MRNIDKKCVYYLDKIFTIGEHHGQNSGLRNHDETEPQQRRLLLRKFHCEFSESEKYENNILGFKQL